MTDVLIKGIVLGLANSLSPGPLMMLIIRDTLRFGPRVGLVVASSSFIADIPLVGLCFFTGSLLLKNDYAKIALSAGGVVMLLRFAYDSLSACPRSTGTNTRSSFWNGLAATLINPHPYLFWILVGVPFGQKALASGAIYAIAYFLAFQAAFVGSNCALALATHSIEAGFSKKITAWAGKVSATVFIILAICLMAETVRALR